MPRSPPTRTSRLPVSISSTGSPATSTPASDTERLSFTKPPDIIRISCGTAPEGSGACDQCVSASAHRQSRGFGIDAAVHLQIDRLAELVDRLADRLDLAQLAGNEALPAKAGIDAHYQHQVDILKDVIEHLGGRRRIERHPGLFPKRLDPLDGAVDMRPSLDRESVV